MSGYIINPIWFYFLGVCGELKIMAGVFSIILVITTLIGFGMYGWDCFYDKKEALENLKKLSIATAIVLVVFAILPSKQTLITMMVSKFATYENAGLTVESIKSIVDYIIEAIKSLG